MTMGPILFVCLHGAAKSVVAAALWKREAARAGIPIDAVARGLEPDLVVSPAAAAGLLAEGIDVRAERPRALTPEDVAAASRIVAFGCELGHLAPPGVPVEQWAEVPAFGDGYAAARAAVSARLGPLLASLSPTAAAPSRP